MENPGISTTPSPKSLAGAFAAGPSWALRLFGLGWNATHLRETLRERRRIQARRRVSDRELMRKIMRPTPMRTLFAYAVRTKSEA
jgi:hypothetical protein